MEVGYNNGDPTHVVPALLWVLPGIFRNAEPESTWVDEKIFETLEIYSYWMKFKTVFTNKLISRGAIEWHLVHVLTRRGSGENLGLNSKFEKKIFQFQIPAPRIPPKAIGPWESGRKLVGRYVGSNLSPRWMTRDPNSADKLGRNDGRRNRK